MEKLLSIDETPSPGCAHIDNLPLYNAADLFSDSRELLINHRGEIYRMRITRHGKLILTK